MGKCKAKVAQTDLGIFTHIQVYSVLFRHIQAYLGIIQIYTGVFRTLCNPGILRTLVCSEPWHFQNQKHIQNPGILRIRGIFRTLSNIYDGAFCENSERLQLFSQYEIFTFSQLYQINIMIFFNTGLTLYSRSVYLMLKKYGT